MAEEKTKKKVLSAAAGVGAVANAAKTASTGVSGSGNSLTIIPKKSEKNRSTDPSLRNEANGTSTDYGTYAQDLDRLTQAQRKAQVDQLKAARTQALANLDAQEQTIKPMYENARNQTAATSRQGARNFAEYLANRGLANSGAAAQAEINRLSSLQNNLGSINNAEANAYRDIANQRTAVENNYVSGLANANNAITNNYYNNLLNYNEQQRQYLRNLQSQALGQYSDNYQAYMNTLQPGSLEWWEAAAQRGNKVANQYNSAMNNALSNVQAGNINYNNAAALGMTVPQAYQYSNNYQNSLATQAALEQEARNREIAQQDLKNQIDLQKLANDTAQTNYNVNKPYNTTVTHVSTGGNKSGSKNTPQDTPQNTPQITAKQLNQMLGKLPSGVQNVVADYLVNNGAMSEDEFRSWLTK